MLRRRTLLTQVLAANLVLITLAVVTTSLVANPEVNLPDNLRSAVVLTIAIGLTVLVNVAMLERRFRPLERLVLAMEQADLTGPGARGLLEPSVGVPKEVERLEQAFKRMLSRLEAERRRAASLALQAQEKERTRIARDLHDEVNQSLTGLLLRLEAARAEAPAALAGELAEIRGLANQAMDELLALSRHLRPTTLDDLGLKAALAGHVEQVRRQSPMSARFSAQGRFDDLPDEVSLVTYRVAQEAISNAVQHSRARELEVRLQRTDPGVELTVRDDGCGVSDSGGDGYGIRGMRERALLAGGRLALESSSRRGTTVRLTI